MLSLPLITPRDDLTGWLQPSTRHGSAHDGPDQSSDQQQQQQSTRRQANRSHTTLLQVIADENAISQRKRNIRRFGAGWIRPPGISKTFQALEDEMAEREEQMILERRDQQMQDLANAQEQEARRQQMMEGGEAQEDAGAAAGEERDLDDDVPEAEDVTFNEESLIEGSMLPAGPDADADADAENTEEVDVERILDLEEAEMSGVGMGMGLVDEERDLDDDVPEAGSYQHTDTEVEDDSSDGEGMVGASVGSLGRARTAQDPPRARESMLSEASEHINSSSFLGSSPAARRGLASGNAFRNRLMGARQQ